MKIDGKAIAQKILDNLKIKAEKLKKKGIIPHLYIITLTTDSASSVYVSQKKLKGGEIGAKITIENLDPSISTENLLGKIEKLNADPLVHGIIIQRPLSPQINEQKIAEAINSKKDVDGFHPNSKFSPPVGEAVLRILEKIYTGILPVSFVQGVSLTKWLKSKKISVVGKGVTAGSPIIKTLNKMGIEQEVITSKTENRSKILKNCDIVICAVGKPDVIKKDELKNGVILIGVGMFKGEDGKFHSDYKEDDIKDTASFYTPTPGGVGPINVAILLSNLLKSAEN